MAPMKRQKVRKDHSPRQEAIHSNGTKNNWTKENQETIKSKGNSQEQTTSESRGLTYSISKKWALIFVIDFLINNWAASRDLLTGIHTNFIPVRFDLPDQLNNTCLQFGWTSALRLILFLTLLYIINHVNNDYRDFFIRSICVLMIIVTCFLTIHGVYRLLLDSEELEELKSLPYWFIITWNGTITICFVLLAYFTLISLPVDDGGGETAPADVGYGRRAWRFADPGPFGKATIFKLLSWYRPFLGYVLLGYVFLIINASVHSLKPYYKAKVIDVIKSDEPSKDLTRLVTILAGIALLESASSAIWSGLSSLVRYRLHFRIRSRLFRWMVNQDMGFFDRTKTGELTSCLSFDSESLGRVLGMVDSSVQSAIHIVVMILSMGQLSWQLTLVVVTGNIYVVIATHFYGKYTKSIFKKTQLCRRQASAIAQEALSSIRTVRSFGAEEEEIQRYGDKCQEHFDLQMKEAWLQPSFESFDQIFTMLVAAGTIYYGGHLVVSGRITSGDLVSFVLYQTQLAAAMSKLLGLHIWVMRALGSSEKVFQYLDNENISLPDGSEEPEHMAGKLEFKNVTFAYPTRPAVNVFNNLSFCIEPGEVVALVGPSGAGKSTCFNLIERFYKPSSGDVLLDTTPLQDLKHSYLRSKLAIVSQEPNLFGRSIRENIRYGLKDDRVTEDGIKEAAVNSNASTFIEGFPEGYETNVGEKGIQLSGGQKQRVAIARALVRDPTILLLDEATSALDTESEKRVQEALDRTLPGRTVMIIAHRLSTVQKADRILVLNSGEIVEQGCHEELLKKEGLYYRLVHRQLVKMARWRDDGGSGIHS